MIIYTLWKKFEEDDLLPYIIDAVDEYVVEEHGFPSIYEARKADPLVREVLITVPSDRVAAIFGPRTIHGDFLGGSQQGKAR